MGFINVLFKIYFTLSFFVFFILVFINIYSLMIIRHRCKKLGTNVKVKFSGFAGEVLRCFIIAIIPISHAITLIEILTDDRIGEYIDAYVDIVKKNCGDTNKRMEN